MRVARGHHSTAHCNVRCSVIIHGHPGYKCFRKEVLALCTWVVFRMVFSPILILQPIPPCNIPKINSATSYLPIVPGHILRCFPYKTDGIDTYVVSLVSAIAIYVRTQDNFSRIGNIYYNYSDNAQGWKWICDQHEFSNLHTFSAKVDIDFQRKYTYHTYMYILM